MNEIVTKNLLAGDQFMSKMHFRQPRCTYSPCGPFTKNKERIQKFKETGDSRYVYQDELDKSRFEHNMAYRDFKVLTRRTSSDKILHDKALNTGKKTKYVGYPRRLASIAYKFF